MDLDSKCMLSAQEGLSGLAGSTDRAELCLPHSSAALKGQCFCQSQALVVWQGVLRLECPGEMSVPSVARGGNPACAALQGCWGAISLPARGPPAPGQTPSWVEGSSQGTPLLCSHLSQSFPTSWHQQEAVTGWCPTPSHAGGTHSPWARSDTNGRKLVPFPQDAAVKS